MYDTGLVGNISNHLTYINWQTGTTRQTSEVAGRYKSSEVYKSIQRNSLYQVRFTICEESYRVLANEH